MWKALLLEGLLEKAGARSSDGWKLVNMPTVSKCPFFKVMVRTQQTGASDAVGIEMSHNVGCSKPLGAHFRCNIVNPPSSHDPE